MGCLRFPIYDRLRELLDYNPETGAFVWKVLSSGRRFELRNKKYAGRIAGCRHVSGYIEIRIDGVTYKAHRLAWLYMTGGWPRNEIDHANLCRSDNRWVNLREATHAQNQANRPARSTSALQLKGVTKNGSGYRGRVQVRGKQYATRTVTTAQEAKHLRDQLAAELLGPFARVG